MKKNEISLELKTIVEPLLFKNKKYFEFSVNHKNIYDIKGKHPNSSFYFIIENSNLNKEGGITTTIKYFPKTRTHHISDSVQIPAKDLASKLNDWMDLTIAHIEIESIYDSPIIEAREREFYSKFKLIDEDADYNPFSYEKIELLDKGIKELIKFLEESKTEDNTILVDNAIEEARSLQKNLLILTKNQIIKGLSELWGKVVKLSTDIAIEVRNKFISNIAKTLLEKGDNIIEIFSNAIS